MTGFQVDTKAVKAAGGVMRSAAARARRLDVETAAGRVAQAMPGSASAAQAPAFSAAWRTAFGSWISGTCRHGEALETNAADYDSVETAVSSAMIDMTGDLANQDGVG